jgi:hypothetical protein
VHGLAHVRPERGDRDRRRLARGAPEDHHVSARRGAPQGREQHVAANRFEDQIEFSIGVVER